MPMVTEFGKTLYHFEDTINMKDRRYGSNTSNIGVAQQRWAAWPYHSDALLFRGVMVAALSIAKHANYAY